MAQAFILMLAGMTSLGAYFLGVKACKFPAHRLCQAIARTGECLGLMIMFSLLNLAVGMLMILGGRWLTGWFVSLYVASDVTLVLLSVLQALIFQAWREASGDDHPAVSREGDQLRREP
jgi:hypothetical protein